LSLILLASAPTVGSAAESKGVQRNGPSRTVLHAIARTLIPPAAPVVAERDAACVEGLTFPSCVDVYFQDKGTLKKRAALFISRARGRGWRLQRSRAAGGERAYVLTRGSYRVV